MWINIITGHSTYMHIGVVVMMHSTRLTIQFCLFGAVCLGVFGGVCACDDAVWCGSVYLCVCNVMCGMVYGWIVCVCVCVCIIYMYSVCAVPCHAMSCFAMLCSAGLCSAVLIDR